VRFSSYPQSEPPDGSHLLFIVDLRPLQSVVQYFDALIVGLTVHGVGNAVLASVSKTEARRVSQARRHAVDELRDKAERAQCLGADTFHPQQLLEILRLPLIGTDKDFIEAVRVNIPQNYLMAMGQLQALQFFKLARNIIGLFFACYTGYGIPGAGAFQGNQIECIGAFSVQMAE